MYSTACLGEWIIVVDFTGFDKPPLHPSSDICPSLAQSIPDFFIKPVAREREKNMKFSGISIKYDH
ncbi:hypothetical protein B296_00054870 [Ensete ventricosum]|uniref:Uncharacterized protein n=1 Tax=Ensete ventricosum TaxID=4639 RepID=A0A426Y237_ENSVE|nr:hypothetical protein B296_00054870 [Ensete ventricosum]